MNKDFEQYVYKRCEVACMSDEKYTKLQGKCADASRDRNMELYRALDCQLGARAEELCYMMGFNDAIKMMLNAK